MVNLFAGINPVSQMEELVYIVLIVVWLLVSFLKRKPKSGKPAEKQQPAQGEAAPAEKEVTVEDMLEEFFGSESKKEKPEKLEPVFDASARNVRKDDGYERMEDIREKDLRDQRDETPMWGQEQQKKDPRFEQYKDKDAVSAPAGSPPEKKQQTIEELIASHKREEAMRAAMEERYDGAGTGLEGFPEFDLRTAVIFSEILNRKYD